MSTTAVPKPIPSLRGEPFWGSMARLNKDRLGFLQEVVRPSGDVGTFRLGPARTVLCASTVPRAVWPGLTAGL